MKEIIKITKPAPFRHRPKGLTILYEDQDILVIDKGAGLLTVKAAYEKEKTAHQILTNYIRKGSLKSKKQLYIVHRLGPRHLRRPYIRQDSRSQRVS